MTSSSLSRVVVVVENVRFCKCKFANALALARACCEATTTSTCPYVIVLSDRLQLVRQSS
jgi:hypothetical protein